MSGGGFEAPPFTAGSSHSRRRCRACAANTPASCRCTLCAPWNNTLLRVPKAPPTKSTPGPRRWDTRWERPAGALSSPRLAGARLGSRRSETIVLKSVLGNLPECAADKRLISRDAGE
jgi:hypothetical protein